MKSSLKNSLRSASVRLITKFYEKPINKEHPIKFVHIGKCGGTSIVNAFRLANQPINQFHLKKPALFERANYFIWIRDPIKRFVSAFNHSKSISCFDISLLKGEKPSLVNCQAPQRIQWKINSGRAYPEHYEHLLQKFESANHLAESLTGADASQRKYAIQLMNYPLEHIYKGIGWYLDHGKFIDLNRNKILFCGSIENMNEDFEILLQKYYFDMKIKPTLNHVRMNKSGFSSSLSKNAKNNIYSFYKHTDYLAIERLVNYDLVCEQLLDLYIKNAHSIEEEE